MHDAAQGKTRCQLVSMNIELTIEFLFRPASYEDTDSSEDEGLPDYKFGGYHPMHVGEVLVNRYMII